MRKIICLILITFCNGHSFAQWQYAAEVAQTLAGTYTDLGNNGTPITTNFANTAMTFDDDNSSVQQIGFNFIYNGTIFNQFVLNTNGFIKLGNTAPAATSYDVLGLAEKNTIAPFNYDLEGGTLPEYRVYTSGLAGSRVCTVQFKNVKEWSSAPSLTQYSNISFQVKLYESSNIIDFVYGSFSVNPVSPSFLQVVTGLQGNSTASAVYVSKAATASWASPVFVNGAYTAARFNNQNDVLPVAGRTFRFLIPQNDVKVAAVYSTGQLPMSYGAPHIVKARIVNAGSSAVSDIPVTLDINGDNVFTNQQKVSLAPGTSTLVSFDPFYPSLYGSNTVKVSVPADEVLSNNNKVYAQTINSNTFSYADDGPSTGNLGFNTGSGLLLARYHITGTSAVTGVNVFLKSSAGDNNTVYAVVLNAAGTVIGQSAAYITNASDLERYISFQITSPPTISNADFYVGLAQTANAAAGYFPLGLQDEEDPARPGAYYYTGLSGGAATEVTSFGRFMIQAVISNNAIANANPYSNSKWTFVKGDSLPDKPAVYGTKGVASPLNNPGARSNAVSWHDKFGNLWLFGGTNDSGYYKNDLWKYVPGTNQWTWMKGNLTSFMAGVYGTKGIAADANTPGGRDRAVGWTDSTGNLWLFGGYGVIDQSTYYLSDLWKYDPLSNRWTWMKGDSTYLEPVYGQLGIAADSCEPGQRFGSSGWADTSGKLWLFGGESFNTDFSQSRNDLWRYDPVKNQWAWMNGAAIENTNGFYGVQGTASAARHPGSRYGAASWTDTSGKLWLFGGNALPGGLNDQYSYINDLWKYDPAINQWAWIKGDTTGSQTGSYGTIGISSSSNKPGARGFPTAWTDEFGNLWLMGGQGQGAIGSEDSWLNDLWKYNASANQWTWVNGATTGNVYGTKDQPGARRGASGWVDKDGYLWLHGGSGFGTSFTGNLSDLWKIFAGTIYIFTGNGDWDDPANWVNNLIAPDTIVSGMVVIIDHIPSGTCNHFGNLATQGGGKLTVMPGRTLNIVNGNLVNKGIMNGNGSIIFSGDNISFVSSSGSIAAPVTLIHKKVYLSGNTNATTVSLTGNSFIKLFNYNLYLHKGDLIGDSNNFVITNGTGTLTRYVEETPVQFHIGIDSSSYTPATITNTGTGPILFRELNTLTGTGDDFGARVAPGVFANAIAGTGPLTDSVVNRTWFISESIVGGSDVSLLVQWNAGDELPGFKRGNAYISHYKTCPPPINCEDGYYEGTTSNSAAGTGPYTLVRAGITSFSPFIVSSRPTVSTFTGNGDWNNVNNWTIGIIPSNIIENGTVLVINPSNNGECHFNGSIIIKKGGQLIIKEGKKLFVTGGITVE